MNYRIVAYRAFKNLLKVYLIDSQTSECRIHFNVLRVYFNFQFNSQENRLSNIHLTTEAAIIE